MIASPKPKDLKKKLSPQQYHVLCEQGTEAPFTGKYVYHKEKGRYSCAACGHTLFSSDTKFDSGTGWPSFSAPLDQKSVWEKEDPSHDTIRTEVTCSKCGSHLGHVFDDGPRPSGLRYCINSAALDFKKKDSQKKKTA